MSNLFLLPGSIQTPEPVSLTVMECGVRLRQTNQHSHMFCYVTSNLHNISGLVFDGTVEVQCGLFSDAVV